MTAVRVLFVSPYRPADGLGHAASDTVRWLVPALGRRVDLALFVPGLAGGEELPADVAAAVEVLPSRIAGAPSAWRFLGLAPAAVRKDWRRRASAELGGDHLPRWRPELVHAEYLQSGDAVALAVSRGVPVVLGLHDVSADVAGRLLSGTHGWRAVHRRIEAARVRRYESTAARRASVVTTLSEPDRVAFAARHVSAVNVGIGVNVPAVAWRPDAARADDLVFLGALWRPANVLAVRFLVAEVMPRVWASRPEARLVIAGARPGQDVRRLATGDHRILLRGPVEDPSSLFRSAAVALVPSVAGGGVLLKVLHAMAAGCPVVTTTSAADGVGAQSGLHLLAGTGAEEIASAAVALLDQPALAERLGREAREHVIRGFSWDRVADRYLSIYGGLVTP